jgi:hypothetical protein
VRSTAQYCSSACRKGAFKSRLSVLSVPPVSTAILSVPGTVGAPRAPFSGASDGIAPLRWRAPLGDKDIRDIRPPSPGTEIPMPDLLAFLDRRPVILKAAA